MYIYIYTTYIRASCIHTGDCVVPDLHSKYPTCHLNIPVRLYLRNIFCAGESASLTAFTIPVHSNTPTSICHGTTIITTHHQQQLQCLFSQMLSLILPSRTIAFGISQDVGFHSCLVKSCKQPSPPQNIFKF